MQMVFQCAESWRSWRAAFLTLLVVALGGGCDRSGGLSHLERTQLARQEAADAIAAKGGSAAEKSYPQGEAWVVDLSGLTIDDAIIRHVQALAKVAELNLSGSTITDAQLETLAMPTPLGTLIKLDISNTQISDAGLMKLTALHLLYEINVKNSRITPAGIEQYQQTRPKHPFNVPLKIIK